VPAQWTAKLVAKVVAGSGATLLVGGPASTVLVPVFVVSAALVSMTMLAWATSAVPVGRSAFGRPVSWTNAWLRPVL
jgi:hypothetical protein